MNFDRSKVYEWEAGRNLPIMGVPPRKMHVAYEFTIEETVEYLRS